MEKRTLHPALLAAFFLLFAVSGFSGLIYESIWTHYLKLFLGHAAYAQTLVLAIFMGGMALGSWACSRYSPRWKNLIIGYCLAEGVIGLFALVFHSVFDGIIQLSYVSIIPSLTNPYVVTVFKWTLSALLILPQSILLGMTFPLMSAGILRVFPRNPGKSIALLYFSNSVGAAIGVLASAFILIRLMGLPGTIRTAGLINIGLALIVWLLVRGKDMGGSADIADEKIKHEYAGRGWYLFLLIASFITGTASFIYEIGWIRMLSLVLGSSTHAFELMLSAFIFGLAFGGLWIQRSIDRIASPMQYFIIVQVLMGLLALSTLPLYGNTFEVMQWILSKLDKTNAGYMIFNLSSHAIALAIMLPATFCAGMTLPLITFLLIRQGHGEKSIGAVYASNTVGAIMGIFFAVHLGMPLLGLKGLIVTGAGLDIALGLALAWNAAAKYKNNRLPAAITVIGISAIVLISFFVSLDPFKMASGVYRKGKLLTPENYNLLYHRDGKTATVSVSLQNDSNMSIRTNGKVDAEIIMIPGREAGPDEYTMTLAAAIPLAVFPEAVTVANIGLGSGLTTHTLLGFPALKQVDTVEIESAMVDAAKHFGYRIGRVYTDPRSNIYIDDAKTFFTSRNKKYDIIISEPSNPWVSGVAGLFSEEFYRLIKNHLTETGVFCQWIQLYEIDIHLVASVLKAISAEFADFVIYAPDDGDILIVARDRGTTDILDYRVLFQNPATAGALKRLHIESMQDIEIRKIGNKKTLDSLVKSYPIRANSDYYPVLDQNAARTRFLHSSARGLLYIANYPLPVLEMLTAFIPSWLETKVNYSPFFPDAKAAFKAMALRDYYISGRFYPRYDVSDEIKSQAQQLRRLFYDCNPAARHDNTMHNTLNIAVTMIPYLTPVELEALWNSLESGPCTFLLTQQEKRWIQLYKAVGNRDARAMEGASRTLLTDISRFTVGQLRYVVAAGMLGSLVEQNMSDALALWNNYQYTMFDSSAEPPLVFMLLVALAKSPS